MEFLRKTWLRVLNNPPVVLGVVVAAINTAQDQTWEGYAVAVAAALLRFFVYGPLSGEKAEPTGRF